MGIKVENKPVICENCKEECKGSPIIWNVPFWFCNNKCEKEFYKIYSTDCDLELGKLITKNKLTGEVYNAV